MELTTSQRDRAVGVLLGTAAGDALGAPYEFGSPLAASVEVAMTGGGSFGWDVGEWTDDTSMAVAIAELTASGQSLLSSSVQDQLVVRWAGWAATAKDVGNQTRAVLSGVSSASAALAASEALHTRTGHTGGNGSLMRTAPVALAYLGDPAGLVDAASSVSRLTHWDPEAGEACVLWCLAIRHAVLTGELDVRVGLSALPPARAAVWLERIEVAERSTPSYFPHNGWVVEAFQAAWSAISAHPSSLPSALAHAVRGGRDTDTVAAIAGGLLGAAHGASAVPASWRSVLHGWPGLDADGLIDLALRTVGAAHA